MQRRNVVGLLQTACLLSVLTSNLLASDPLDTWAWRNPLPNGTAMNGVAYGAGLIVGVGTAGTIMTSTNLTTASWVKQSIGANVSTLNAIAYGNGTFVVAVGDSIPAGDKTQRFLTSTDGTNWVARTWPNSNTRAVYSLAYGAGLFVAVCERAEIWTSPDGITWTQRTSPQTGSSYTLTAVTYRPDVGFAAVGNTAPTTPEIVTSPDGITWTLQSSSALAAYSLNGITWGYFTNADTTVTTNYVAVGGKSSGTPLLGTIATSPDGVSWTTQLSAESGTNTPGRLYATAFRPGVGYVALGKGGVIQTSVDGTNWISSWSDGRVAGNDFAGAAYAPDLGYFIGVGSSGMVETAPVGSCTSCKYPASDWTAEFGGRPENLTGITRGNVNFAAVGIALAYAPNNAIILTSPSGSSWTVRVSNTPNKLASIAYGAGTFVAVGASGTIVTSSDEGTNWAVQTSVTGNSLNGVSYLTNGVTNVFLATGASGTILTSPDGTNWTVQTSGTTTILDTAAYGANLFVVGGNSGLILTSPDCTTWTPRLSASSIMTKYINSLAFGNNIFVGACSYGYILTSPDGITWTAQTSPFGSTGSSKSYSSVVYGNGTFVMAGSTSSYVSAIQSSPDGITWTIRNSPSSSSSFATLTYAPNTFLGVGNGGMIMQAGALLPPQIYYTYAGGTLTLTWSGGGNLQAASPSVSGPYTNVPGAVSPWPITPLSEPSMFFRVQAP